MAEKREVDKSRQVPDDPIHEIGIQKEIAARVDIVRREFGLTQDELRHEIVLQGGKVMSEGKVSEMLRGMTPVPAALIYVLRTKYQVRLDWLFLGTGERYLNTPHSGDAEATARLVERREVKRELVKVQDRVKDLLERLDSDEADVLQR